MSSIIRFPIAPKYVNNELCKAITNKNLDRMEQLIQKGGNINYINENDMTVMHLAIAARCYEILQKLLCKYRADANKINRKTGATVIHFACEKNDRLALKLLCEHGGADINVTDMDLNTPLHYCAQYNSRDTCAELLRRKININARNSLGRTALYEACSHSNLEIVRMICSNNHCNFHIADNDGKTPLNIAYFKQNLEIIMLLRENGAT